MRYQDLRLSILDQWAQPKGNLVAYFIDGKPGGGKSARCRDIVAAMGGTDENTVEFNASTRDPVDMLGTPNNDGEVTRWVPPEEFWKLRAGQGRVFLILEEMSDAPMPMQNAMCRAVHDHFSGNLKLSDGLFIIGSGNRTQDKSGANRLSTKLGNRMRHHHFEENLEDWVQWAQERDPWIDPVLIQFLRYIPAALSDFDPSRPDGINATPRSWESVSRINPNLRSDLFFAECTGSVGEARASQYVSFRKVYAELVSLEDVLMNPKGVPIPTDLSALYATVGSIGHGTTLGNVERLAEFVDRLPADFNTMYWMDARKKEPKIKGTKPFIAWATANANVICN